MRSILLSIATGAALSFGAVAAQAMPTTTAFSSADAPELILVADGCGPGFHHGAYGVCRPNGFYRPFFHPHCYVRPTPYGPRRICN
jgi:hypothetical protein